MSSTNAPAIPLKEFDIEMATTRRLLERVPFDKGDFKPHEKSFPLSSLAQLVSSIPGWIAMTLVHDKFDLTKSPGYKAQKTESLVEQFDKNVHEARAALETVTGDKLEQNWSLTRGDFVLMTGLRGESVRQHLSHLIHHRGQLSVYERMVDVPIPQIYGPTADEPWKG